MQGQISYRNLGFLVCAQSIPLEPPPLHRDFLVLASICLSQARVPI
jgi:hypothetical protein